MATSSIKKNFVVSGEKQVEKFANAIEESYQESLHRVSTPEFNISYLKGSSEIKEFMTRRKKVMHKSTFERIYDVVKQIPYGKVATYGQVAALAGNKRWARVVGYALHANPDPEHIPCYRVVNRLGEVSKAFAFGGENKQIEFLMAEGIEFVDGKVDMKKYQWNQVTIDILR